MSECVFVKRNGSLKKENITIALGKRSSGLAEKFKGSHNVFVFTPNENKKTNVEERAKKLKNSLSENGITAKTVIVASSYMGLMAIHFAHRFPESVAGLVLVDASHPRFVEAVTRSIPEEYFSNDAVREFCERISRYEAEGLWWKETCEIVRKPPDLVDLPLHVLAAGKFWDNPEKLPGEVVRNIMACWHGLQREHASLSSRSTFEIVEDSSHSIASIRPDAVKMALREVLRKCREARQN